MNTLQALGFTEYEARAYVTLLEREECNGYELAKASGIPRANVYAVIEKLLRRGAARRLETADGPRYAAVPSAQMLRGIELSQQRALVAAGKALARMVRPREPGAVFNLRGNELTAKLRQMIDAAEHTLLIAIQPAEAAQFADPLRMARERGVAITTLCLDACPHECGHCQGDIHRYQLARQGQARWLVLVADDRDVIIAQIGVDVVEAVHSEQRLLVQLASAYIRQSVTLAVLGSELAGEFEGLLSREARQMLDRLDTAGDFLASVRTVAGVTSS
ncbi:MAG: TrmB family transcriptional regulator [Rudaea sp.]